MHKFLITLYVLAQLLVNVHAASVDFAVGASPNSSSGGSGLGTGLFYNLGDPIVGAAAADDIWSAGPLPRWSNADGLVVELFATGSDESGFVAGTKIGDAFAYWNQDGLSAPYGSLVGRIASTFFFLGTDFNVNAPAAGELALFYWDENAADNLDTVLVSIESSAVPLPSAIYLLGGAALGLFGLRRN